MVNNPPEQIDNLYLKALILLHDFTSGTGGFLVTAMTYAMKQLKIEFEKETGKLKSEWNDFEKKPFKTKSQIWL